jgi:hypothetical protein
MNFARTTFFNLLSMPVANLLVAYLRGEFLFVLFLSVAALAAG